MRNVPARKTLALLTLAVVGLGFSGGCGGDTPPTGAVVTEDLKSTQDREKMISEQYKKNSQSPKK